MAQLRRYLVTALQLVLVLDIITVPVGHTGFLPMTDQIPKDSAKSRTLPLLPQYEPEEVTVRASPAELPNTLRSLLMWETSDVCADVVSVTAMRYRNGNRGLRFDRGQGAATAEFLVAPDMWLALAQIVFRDSKILRKLLQRPELQEDSDIQALRIFMFTGKKD